MNINPCIYYEGGSKKYVLKEIYKGYIPFTPSKDIYTPYCRIDKSGWIQIDAGYEWDGASGPTIDTPDTMDGSLVHDVLYQLLREGVLGGNSRKFADKCIREMCITDGMPKWRANYWYFFLRCFGGGSAR